MLIRCRGGPADGLEFEIQDNLLGYFDYAVPLPMQIELINNPNPIHKKREVHRYRRGANSNLYISEDLK